MKIRRSADAFILLILAVALVSLIAFGCDSGSSSSTSSSSTSSTSSSSGGCDGGTDPTPTPTPTPDPGGSGDSNVTTTFQAEEATIVSGVVESDHSGYTGSGYANTDNASGNYIEFALTATEADSYDLTFYYALESGNRYGSIQVNGTTVVSNIDFNATGAWTTWGTSAATVYLSSGANTIRVTAQQSGGLPNMDKMEVYGYAVTQGGSSSSSSSSSSTSTSSSGGDKTFIVTAVQDNLDNNDFYVMANGLKSLGYTQVVADTNVYSSELIDYAGRTITTLYHTGHGDSGLVATYDGSVSTSNVTLRAQNTIFATCLTMKDTSWKNRFTSTAETLMGYTNYSYDIVDDEIAQNMVNQLGNSRTYQMAWYLANAGNSYVSDRWAEYVREGSSIVEYSARTGNIPKSSASATVSLEAKGLVTAVADLAGSSRNFRSSFGRRAAIKAAKITTAAKSREFNLTRPVTISAQEAIDIAEDWLADNNSRPDDAVLDRVVPVQRRADEDAQPEVVGYSVHFCRNIEGTRVSGNRIEDHITMLVDQNSVVAESRYWPVVQTLLSASDAELDDLLSVGEAVRIAADEIANVIKQGEPIDLIEAEPVYGTLGPGGGQQRLVPAFRVRSAEGHLFVIDATTGKLLL